MAEEVENPASEPAEEGGLVVEVVPDRGKPQLSDGDVTKLDQLPPEDEIGRYAADAQKRIKNLHIANQEWRRRVVTANKDVATATTLAEQLYRENQELRANMGRSEQALIEQAIQRAEAQLEQANARAKAAYAAQDGDAIVKANEEVARYVAEADRLRLLKPAAVRTGAPAGGAEQATPSQASPAPQPQPESEALRQWKEKNPWFLKPGEEDMSGFALGVHENLQRMGITEFSDPERYWGTIDRRLREVYPQRFAAQKAEPESVPAPRRPVAVAGATRVNGGTSPKTPRQIRLSESQVRIAHQLGLTPEQYAAQLIKEDQAKGVVQ